MKVPMLALLLLSGAAWGVSLEDERDRLLQDGQPVSEGLSLDVPTWVEDGAFVPVTVRLTGAEAPVELALLRSAEPDPRIARVTAYRAGETLEFSTRVRLLESQQIEVIARDAAGRSWQASQSVQIAGSSCLAPPGSDPLESLGQTRAWLREQGENVELVSLLRHPMETGRRKDGAGTPLPRRLITSMEVDAGGEQVMHVEPHEGMAANPYWRLLLEAGSASAGLRWVDADGSVYQHEVSLRSR